MANPIEQYPVSRYNAFRSPQTKEFSQGLTNLRPGHISKAFDEPTYLTFYLRFSYKHVDLDPTDFDRLPMPLFNDFYEDDLNARTLYSTRQYLRDSDENIRERMLVDFIQGWNNLQDNYQYYFQEISGFDSMLTIDPAKGQRIPSDGRITIKMMEGLDLRVTHLLDLYRKVAWDDNYQRWILPDFMRNFHMQVYVTEFRSFHRSNISSRVAPDQGQADPPMILELIESATPVYILEFDKCEFDIASIKKIPDSATVASADMREIEFSIKAGNVNERYINPILNSFYFDLYTNGYERVAETTAGSGSAANTDLNYNTSPYSSFGEVDYAKGDLLAPIEHQSGRPFLQSGLMDNMKNASPNYSNDVNSVNPTDPATWVGNTLTLGKALVGNLVKSKIDEIKTQPIPGLGISFTEALAAIQSKNVFTLFGAARKAFGETVAGTLPSQELESNFVDTQMRGFLEGIATSEATDDDALELVAAANQALNDKGTWERIKDLSKATDLVSTALGEIDSPSPIEAPNALKQSYLAAQTPTKLQSGGLVMEGLPSSSATQSKIEGAKIQQPSPGQATDKSNVQIESIQSAETGSTEGSLPEGFQVTPSSKLGVDAGESLVSPEGGLGNEATGGYEVPQPSEQLGTDVKGGMEQPELSEGKIEGTNLPRPEPGEAVDGDPIDAKPLPIPSPSKATNNKLDQ